MTQSISTPRASTVVVIPGQGIGPECMRAAQTVLAATGAPLEYRYGTLGYPDAAELFTLLQQHNPGAYDAQFAGRTPEEVAATLEQEAKNEARALGNINEFYKRLLLRLKPEVLAAVKAMVTALERETLQLAMKSDAVLKGALRTLDEGDEPSRNVTIRKAFEQYANIRRCVTLDPIAPGAPGADILFVRENVEDLYASIEHRLARNYPQALRHQTPEGCELICRAAFEAALRDGRKKVTALEKPNILKITGGLFKETFLKVAKDYHRDVLGEAAIEANFMIIDDGLAAIAANPEKFDVVVTSNMFGDIGSDIAAKVTGGVGLVSSNNTNPANPRAVSMFETMGGTADDIAGQNLANPVALIDAAAEMLLHIGGAHNILAADLMKAAVLQVLADGEYVGDIKRGAYQEKLSKEKSGTQEFAAKIAAKIRALRELKAAHPERSVKALAMDSAPATLRPLFDRILKNYEHYATTLAPASQGWSAYSLRNTPPNPPRADSEILGFDLFVDDSGMQCKFLPDGRVDEANTRLDPEVSRAFTDATGIVLSDLFHEGKASSLQSIRSFGDYSARSLRTAAGANQALLSGDFASLLSTLKLEAWQARFAASLLKQNAASALSVLDQFAARSRELTQGFYRTRAGVIRPILAKYGFMLVRITSRGTEIYPTMGDFEKRDVDRYRIEIDPKGKLAGAERKVASVQTAMMQAVTELVERGWMISETMLNRRFTDGEGAKQGVPTAGVSKPYAMGLGTYYADDAQHASDAAISKAA